MYFLNRRIILISGKGGVGRTAVAAALARATARAGRRTLVLEIGYEEGAQSALGAQFDRDQLSEDAVSVAENLSVGRLSARTGHAQFLRTILPSKTLIAAALRSKAVRKFLVAAPSLHEMGIFYHLLTLAEKTRKDGRLEHELLILDMPATGHTLALTGLPRILLRLIPGGPIARALHAGQALLNDPDKGAAWIVTLPEKLPVTEACELVDGLRETNMPVGGIMLNRMPPDPFTEQEALALREHLSSDAYFGRLTLERISTAKRARAHLEDRLEQPVLVLPEVSEAGSIIDSLSTEFGRLMDAQQ